MRGSVAYQVQVVYECVAEIGSSKHEVKGIARSNGAKTWHQIGKQLGVMSYSTADAYRDVWRQALKFAKEHFKINDIEKLSGEHLKAFLLNKIDSNVAHATHAQYAAALEKLEVALNRFAAHNKTGRDYDFSSDIKEARSDAKNLERFDGSRAYANPDYLVQSVQSDLFQLAAAIQRESGARISEANHINSKQLRGVKTDVYTGRPMGWIHVEGKGGKEREIAVSLDTYARLQQTLSKGRFEFNMDSYRKALEKAAKKTGQSYEGSHGLRWSWAQERHAILQQNGLTYEQTLSRISQEMGHERGDITEHYLR